ncbi:MAG TPA: hypothetical protein VGO68_03410 [Pyrinomonadaceae bacterium]|nr:hypothetical protein [Pyrinomonadaceae bacterium]
MNKPADPNKLVPGEGPYDSPFGLGVVPRIFLLAASVIVAVVAGLMAWRGSRVESPPTPQTQSPQATPSATATPAPAHVEADPSTKH